MPDTLLNLERLKGRLRGCEVQRIEGGARAAVAAIFREDGRGFEVLLIHRAEDPRDPWSGHLAFPGGKVDPGDRSVADAAMRETQEEIGLDLESQAVFLGRFSDLEAVAKGRRQGLVIEPFAFELCGSEQLVLNHEVQEAFWLPVSFLADRGRRSSMEYVVEGRKIRLPCYRWEGRVLWGLTLKILDEVVELVTGEAFGDWPARETVE